MRPRISIWGRVRRSVRPSLCNLFFLNAENELLSLWKSLGQSNIDIAECARCAGCAKCASFASCASRTHGWPAGPCLSDRASFLARNWSLKSEKCNSGRSLRFLTNKRCWIHAISGRFTLKNRFLYSIPEVTSELWVWIEEDISQVIKRTCLGLCKITFEIDWHVIFVTNS